MNGKNFVTIGQRDPEEFQFVIIIIYFGRHNISKRHAHRVVRQASTIGSCPRPAMSCANSRYRTIDGSCNNLNVPWWGMAGTPQARLFGYAYEDGRSVPRGGFNSYLTNPRHVSHVAHPDRYFEFPFITNMVPQFGQFLDHDISLTPEEGKISELREVSSSICYPC